jgi:hypothetical protein
MHLFHLLSKVVLVLAPPISIIVLLLNYYAMPDIKYREKINGHVHRLLLQNMEPSDLSGKLVVLLSSKARIKKVEVFGGPCVEDPPAPLQHGADAIKVVVKDFPAEGVVVISVEFERGIDATLDTSIAHDSPIRPQNLIKMPNFAQQKTRLEYFLPKLAVGLLLGQVSLCAFMWIARRIFLRLPIAGLGFEYRDGLFFGALAVISLILFPVIVSMSGKETVSGYDGWEGRSLVWEAPAE